MNAGRCAWRRRYPCPAGGPVFSAAISSMALRTVPWETLKRTASSDSLGMASPGCHSRLQALQDQIPICR